MDKQIIIEAYLSAGKNIRKAARMLDMPRRTFRYYISKGYLDDVTDEPLSDRVRPHRKEKNNPEKPQPVVDGQVHPTPVKVLELPNRKPKRYILTSAQNNTRVNEEFWKNLMALKQHYDAEMFVGTYTYNHSAYGAKNIKYGSEQEAEDGLWFDERLVPYIQAGDNENIDLAPGLRWCGRANILPTAQRPLSGFETYTGLNSGIFPHAKIAMQSVPSGKYEPSKMNYTTGTVTQRNYIQKKAGLKAEHHHTYGALVVEVCPDGTWFVRQINADSAGTIHDLRICVTNGFIEDEDCLGINWGDIHEYKADDVSFQLCWGEGGILDELKPDYQFMNDLVDFYPRNHHDIGNHHAMFERHVRGCECVETEMKRAADFLNWAQREFCQTVVVESNHDSAFKRWLQEADFKKDPINALYYLKSQFALYKSIQLQDSEFNLIEWALKEQGADPSIVFLKRDESFIIAGDKGGGIECGIHGHLGPNGSRGNARTLAKIGRKANIGHSHSAGIEDGLYVAGVTGKLDMGYNIGPSSWSQSHILTYKTGKRAIITISNGRWRA
jgi:hypothetical protein